MRTHLYLDCFSGISGNMLLGALLDAGVPETYLRASLAKLNIDKYRLDIEKKSINNFSAYLVQVECEKSHHHRNLSDITTILNTSSLEVDVIRQATRVFQQLGEAEAAVHGTTIDKIHFHEVGATDAIIDIVGVVAGIHYLAPTTITCSPLPMPRGWVHCAHGEMPLPAPAVCKLLKDVPVYGESLQQELVTPTGAALAVTLAQKFGPMPSMILESTGYGAGTMKREDNRPNLLRIHIGRETAGEELQVVEVLETHIDDWNSELWPHVSTLLIDKGALDVSLTPMLMKKGRPGYLVRVICGPELVPTMQQVLFAETSSIGMRSRREYRVTLPREKVWVETPWGKVQAKKIITPEGIVITPEYEACKQLAEEKNIALQTVYAAVGSSTPTPASGD